MVSRNQNTKQAPIGQTSLYRLYTFENNGQICNAQWEEKVNRMKCYFKIANIHEIFYGHSKVKGNFP